MLFFAVGWLAHTILQEIMLADQKAEASYPTMNRDFGKLIGYLLGKVFRTILYIITVIPGLIYGTLSMPRSFWTVLFIEAFCFGIWVWLARSDVFQSYQKRYLYLIQKQYAYWKPHLKKMFEQIQTKLSQNEFFKGFLEKINGFRKMNKDKDPEGKS